MYIVLALLLGKTLLEVFVTGYFAKVSSVSNFQAEKAHKNDWVKIFSPQQYHYNIGCLKFRYYTSYLDIRTMAYNDTDTVQVHKILYDGSFAVWHLVELTVLPGWYGIMFEFRNQYGQPVVEAGISEINIHDGKCNEGMLMLLTSRLTCSEYQFTLRTTRFCEQNYMTYYSIV